MNLKIGQKHYECKDTVTLYDLAEEMQGAYSHRIAIASVNGKLTELFHSPQDGDRIEFITIGDKIGHDIYRRSCSMLFLTALSHVMQGKSEKETLHFSIHAGFYYTFEPAIAITQDFLDGVEEEMSRLVAEAVPFEKRSVSTDDAIRLFHDLKMHDKEKLFSVRLSSRVNIYDLDGYQDYYYGFMVHDASALKYFRLYAYHDGIVLQMPELKEPETVPDFQPSEQLFHAQIKGEEWAKKQNIGTVADLNEKLIETGAKNTILISEALMEKRIADIAERIIDRQGVKFVMIAGPSSSGKTTFSQRLSVQLEAQGMKPHYIGVDNYFLNRDQVPLDEYGKKDFESLRAVDVDQFNRDMTDALEGKTIQVPTFDFLSGKRICTGETLTLKEGEILIIEGIHCLNDRLSFSLPKESKFKIYISALTQVNLDEHNRISTTDGRLIRRIVRDFRTRGYSASNTLAMWDSVRRGEEKYIFPLQEGVDVFFNSALPYELAVLKLYAEPLLFQVKKEDPEYGEARRLLKFLDYVIGIPAMEDVPNHSILREFIGGGCFRL